MPNSPIILQRLIIKQLDQARHLWKLACLHEGYPPDTKFAEFSRGNPYVAKHSAVMQKMFAYRRHQKRCVA